MSELKADYTNKQSLPVYVFFALYILSVMLPGKGIFQYICPALCIIIYVYISNKNSMRMSIPLPFLRFFLVWAFCLMMGQAIPIGQANTGALIHEILRCLLYFVIALGLCHLKINRNELVVMTAILLIINFTIQILELYNVQQIYQFIVNNYLRSDDLRHLSLSIGKTIATFRSGSVFINPNVYCPIGLICFGAQLGNIECIIAERKSIGYLRYLILGIGAFSLFLTGSRTALLAVAIMMFVFAIKIFSKKPIIVFLIGCIFMIALVSLANVGARSTMISEGIEDSFGVKITELFRYISEVNPISFIVGNRSNIGSTEWGFDFEWGYIFVYTGIVGLVNYFWLISKLVKQSQKPMWPFYKYVLVALIIETLSATVFYNSYAYPLLALFVFTKGFESDEQS